MKQILMEDGCTVEDFPYNEDDREALKFTYPHDPVPDAPSAPPAQANAPLTRMFLSIGIVPTMLGE